MTNDELKEACTEAVLDFFSKEALLKRCEATFKEVDVPQLGKKIRVKILSSREVSDFQSQFIDDDPVKKKEAAVAFKYTYVGRCLCDDNGTPLFSEAEIPSLGNMPARDIEVLFAACTSVNPMGSEAEVEKEVKNSD